MPENKHQQAFFIWIWAVRISDCAANTSWVFPSLVSFHKSSKMTVSYVAGDRLFELTCCREQKYISCRFGSWLSDDCWKIPGWPQTRALRWTSSEPWSRGAANTYSDYLLVVNHVNWGLFCPAERPPPSSHDKNQIQLTSADWCCDTVCLNCRRQNNNSGACTQSGTFVYLQVWIPAPIRPILSPNYRLADFELQIFLRWKQNFPIFRRGRLLFGISRFAPHLMKSAGVLSSTEKCYHFPDSIFTNAFSSITTTTRLSPTITLSFPSPPSEPRAMALVKTMPGGVFGHQMSFGCVATLAPISAPTCVSVCIWAPRGRLRHILQDATAFRSTMALRLLCCGAPGTSLIIYLACVYLCWTRLSGGGSREGEADTILPAGVRGAPKIRRDRRHCGDVRSCLRARARLRDRGGNDANGVTVWLTHQHAI